MLTRRRKTKSPTTIKTSYTLTMIRKDGTQSPIGEKGSPTFFPFSDWTTACDAIGDAVGSMAGLAHIDAVVVVTTQTRADEFGGAAILVVSLRKFNTEEITEIYEGQTDIQPDHSVTRADGRSVRVTIPE